MRRFLSFVLHIFLRALDFFFFRALRFPVLGLSSFLRFSFFSRSFFVVMEAIAPSAHCRLVQPDDDFFLIILSIYFGCWLAVWCCSRSRSISPFRIREGGSWGEGV